MGIQTARWFLLTDNFHGERRNIDFLLKAPAAQELEHCDSLALAIEPNKTVRHWFSGMDTTDLLELRQHPFMA